MKKEFVIRGRTAGTAGTSGKDNEEILNFSGHKKGYAYKLIEFVLYPTTNFLAVSYEQAGSITAAKVAMPPTDPDFNNEGLIGTAFASAHDSSFNPFSAVSIVNDTFLITQDLILKVEDSIGNPVNWQCRFESVKMSGPEEAVANYKQFTISDE